MDKLILMFFILLTSVLQAQVFPDRVYFLNHINLLVKDVKIDSACVSTEKSKVNQFDLNQWLYVSKFKNESNVLRYYFNSSGLLDSFKSQFEFVESKYDINEMQTYLKLNLNEFEDYCRFELEKEFTISIDSVSNTHLMVSRDSLFYRSVQFCGDSIVELTTTLKKHPKDSSFIDYGKPVFMPCGAGYHNFFGWYSPGCKIRKVTYFQNGQIAKKIINISRSNYVAQVDYTYSSNLGLSGVRLSVISEGIVNTIMTQNIYYGKSGSIQKIKVVITDFSIHEIKKVNNSLYSEKIEFISKRIPFKKRKYKIFYQLFTRK